MKTIVTTLSTITYSLLTLTLKPLKLFFCLLMITNFASFVKAEQFAEITEKTVIVWVSLDNLEQRGVQVMRLENPWKQEPNHNTLSFGDLAPKKWMVVSTRDGLMQRDQSANPLETSPKGELIQMAVVYRNTDGKNG